LPPYTTLFRSNGPASPAPHTTILARDPAWSRTWYHRGLGPARALRHKETECMRQDAGRDPHQMPCQTPPTRPLHIERGAQDTEHRLDPMSQPAQGALHAVRPLLLLVILAQGQQQNPFLAPQALFQRCVVVNLVSNQ